MDFRWSLIPLLSLLAAASYGAEPEHPRIFLTRADLPRLRRMAADEQKNALDFVPADAWKKLQARADAFAAAPYHYAVEVPGQEGAPSTHWEYTFSVTPPPRHDDSQHYPIWTAMFQERTDSITTRLQYFALAYLVSKEPRYLEKAKEIVFTLCAWPGIWTDPSYGGGKPCLDTGHAATWVSIFYDWCYDGLSEAERRTVRAALIEKALAPINDYLDTVSPYHNFTAVLANGLCLGGIALQAEEPRAAQWIKHALTRAKLNFDAQGKDGGAMEGPMYGTYAAENFADMIWALNTAGLPNPLLKHPYLQSLPRYCISLLNPNNFQQPCFGDGGPGVGFGSLMLSLALGGNGDAAWYCQKTGQFEPSSVRRFLALDPARLHPQQPAQNPSDCFVDVGYAILRDGYAPDSAFLAFKSGPPTADIGHNHFDQNSYMINYGGSWAAWDPGYRDYFNPPVRRYTSGTIGHNTIVLDMDDAYLKEQAVSLAGHDQVRLNGGRITEFFTSKDFDYVCGEAAAAYNQKKTRVLNRFDRQIFFVKPGLFFIRDLLEAPEAHRYSSLLHLAGGGAFRIEGDHADAVSSSCLLQTHVYSPLGIHLAAGAYPGAEAKGPYLAATTGKAKAATILTVLAPRRKPPTLMNPGFEEGMAGWIPRSATLDHHVIDTVEKHSGTASARIDKDGYYYTEHIQVKPGTRITARWWGKCTGKNKTACRFYYWRDGKAFASKDGPIVQGDAWKEYTLSDTAPEGTVEFCLALEATAEKCWFDDVSFDIELHDDTPDMPAQITSLADGAQGAVAVVNGVTHLFLCGKAGEWRVVNAGGHRVGTDAAVAILSLKPEGPVAFLLHGARLECDGKKVAPTAGVWRVQR